MPRIAQPESPSSSAFAPEPAAAELLRAMARLRDQLERTTRERDRLTIQLAQNRRTQAPVAQETARESVDTRVPAALPPDAQAEIEMARQVIASLEEQCQAANKRAAGYRDELAHERRSIVALRRRIAQLTDGWRTRAPVAAWAPAQNSPAPIRAEEVTGQRATVRLAAVS